MERLGGRRRTGMTAGTLLLAAVWILCAGATAAASAAQQSVPTQITGQASAGQGASAAAGSAELSRLNADALGWLQQLMRINTTNPPGNEMVAAKYIADILEKEGIHAEIFESTPGRGILVARLSASAVPDPSRALLLMAHLDVVGVDKSKWTVGPVRRRRSRTAICTAAARLTTKE